MKLRSSRIVGIPNHSYSVANIPYCSSYAPCYSYRSTQSVIFMNIICLSGVCIVVTVFILYTILNFCIHLPDEIIEPTVKFNLSNLLTDII